MIENEHERATRMISAEHVEGLPPEERQWLKEHLSVCFACSRKADALSRAVLSVRSMSVRVDPLMIRATVSRVRNRAAEIEEQRRRVPLLWGAASFSFVWMVITGALMWYWFAWLGRSLGWADGVWLSIFLVGWFFPATLVALTFVLMRRPEFSKSQHLLELCA